MRRLASTRRDIVTQSPPGTAARQRDKLLQVVRDCEADIREGMPTGEEMRRNPPGVADRHRKWDRAKKVNVLRWKTARQLLDPQNDDKDYLNVETLRRPGLTQNLDVNAQIPGVFALSPQAKANYGAINWDSPEVAAEIQKLIDAGKLKVNRGVKRGALRAPGNYKTFEAPDGTQFTGPFGKPNYERYLKRQEAKKREEGAVA